VVGELLALLLGFPGDKVPINSYQVPSEYVTYHFSFSHGNVKNLVLKGEEVTPWQLLSERYLG
jgi:hypothetical protein